MKFLATIILSAVMCLSFIGNLFSQQNNTEKMNILFIGNSYTHMNNMPGILQKIADKKDQNVNIEKNTHSGFTFREHCERADMWEALKSKKWDKVVLQGYSRELANDYVDLDTATIPYMRRIMDTIYAHNPCTDVFLYVTWGYKDGFEENEAIDSFAKMSEKIYYGYQYVNEILDTRMVPVGLVWSKLRETHPEINLYAPDDQHPNKNGSYLSACTFYASLFNDSPVGAITSTIGTKEAGIIQNLCNNFVSERRDILELNKNTFHIQYKLDAYGKHSLSCKSYFPNAKSVTWDFGNGSVSTKSTIKYLYPKGGTYTVKLTVQEACGTKTYYKKLTFKDPVKPKTDTKKSTSQTSKKK